MVFSDFIPPVLTKIKNRIFDDSISEIPKISTFSSFTDALNGTSGYQNKDLVDIVVRKTIIYKNNILHPKNQIDSFILLQNILAFKIITELTRSKLNVVDFGGACGASFFSLNNFFPELIGKWHVVDTPDMVQKARVIETSVIGFFEELDTALSGLDLPILFLSGVLQYLPDPLAALTTMVEKDIPFIYLTRTSFSDHPDIPLITSQQTWISHHGPRVTIPDFKDYEISFPRTLLSKVHVENIFKKHYEILYEFPSDERNFFLYKNSTLTVYHKGYLFRKKL